MKLPNVSNNIAVLLMAAAIAVVTWMIIFWPGEDKRRLPVTKPEPSVTYVRTDFDHTVQPDAPAPAAAP